MSSNLGYLEKIKDNHKKYGHDEMAKDIASAIRNKFSGIIVEVPRPAENGRYVVVFITLIPDKVRMAIQLTDSGLDQHVYNLKPVSDLKLDVDQFKIYMSANHAEIALKNAGLYAKLPKWKSKRLKNNDLEQICQEVLYAINYFK